MNRKSFVAGALLVLDLNIVPVRSPDGDNCVLLAGRHCRSLGGD